MTSDDGQERSPRQSDDADAAAGALEGDDFTDEMTQGEAEADADSGATSGSGGESVNRE